MLSFIFINFYTTQRTFIFLYLINSKLSVTTPILLVVL